jgi:hypothetical protein
MRSVRPRRGYGQEDRDALCDFALLVGLLSASVYGIRKAFRLFQRRKLSF